MSAAACYFEQAMENECENSRTDAEKCVSYRTQLAEAAEQQ